ncbi:TetR/AcrR family transcriptional regulator [Rhodospirillum sp. A1_3_36]|uniref:TetR/AcrR family transcriptional regulator n=1 Tax=Rhodospirillum sp. A1_3_36 TaxID=3391666 RepID=UPI0039A657BC
MALRESKRRQIVDAAISEFLENGFGGASMDRIATRAMVSKRTVYNHFQSKEDLFRTIVGMAGEEARTTLNVTYDPSRPLRPQLVELGQAEGRLIRSASFMRMMRMAMGEVLRDATLAAELNRCSDHLSIFNAFFAAAKASGALITDDSEMVSSQFIALIKATTFWPSVLSGRPISAEDMDRVVEHGATTIVAAFGAPEADSAPASDQNP